MDGRNGGLDQLRNGACAAQVIQDFLSVGAHGAILATIATSMQAQSCDNRFCEFRIEPLDDPVDQMEIVGALRERKMKQVAVANLLGISTDKVSKSFKGPEHRRFTGHETQILLQFLGEAPPPPTNGPRLPIIGLVPAGNWREAIEQPLGYMPSPDPSLPKEAFVVRVDGDSMDEIAEEGTHVVVNPLDKQLITRKLYVIRNSDGEVTFKRFMPDPARFVPVSSNKRHTPIMVGEDGFDIVGRAVMKAEWL